MSFGHIESEVSLNCSRENISKTIGYMTPELSGQKNVGVFSILVKWPLKLSSWMRLSR